MLSCFADNQDVFVCSHNHATVRNCKARSGTSKACADKRDIEILGQLRVLFDNPHLQQAPAVDAWGDEASVHTSTNEPMQNILQRHIPQHIQEVLLILVQVLGKYEEDLLYVLGNVPLEGVCMGSFVDVCTEASSPQAALHHR